MKSKKRNKRKVNKKIKRSKFNKKYNKKTIKYKRLRGGGRNYVETRDLIRRKLNTAIEEKKEEYRSTVARSRSPSRSPSRTLETIPHVRAEELETELQSAWLSGMVTTIGRARNDEFKALKELSSAVVNLFYGTNPAVTRINMELVYRNISNLKQIFNNPTMMLKTVQPLSEVANLVKLMMRKVILENNARMIMIVTEAEVRNEDLQKWADKEGAILERVMERADMEEAAVSAAAAAMAVVVGRMATANGKDGRDVAMSSRLFVHRGIRDEAPMSEKEAAIGQVAATAVVRGMESARSVVSKEAARAAAIKGIVKEVVNTTTNAWNAADETFNYVAAGTPINNNTRHMVDEYHRGNVNAEDVVESLPLNQLIEIVSKANKLSMACLDAAQNIRMMLNIVNSIIYNY